jgi:hypothetical protein
MDGNSTDPPSSYHSSHFSLTLNARSDENSRRKVQNVVTDSTAEFFGPTGSGCRLEPESPLAQSAPESAAASLSAAVANPLRFLPVAPGGIS